jgi:hypothetical protein
MNHDVCNLFDGTSLRIRPHRRGATIKIWNWAGYYTRTPAICFGHALSWLVDDTFLACSLLKRKLISLAVATELIIDNCQASLLELNESIIEIIVQIN